MSLEFAETYEHFAAALRAQKDGVKNVLIHVRAVSELGRGRFRLDLRHEELLKHNPEEGWNFAVPDKNVSGRINRVEASHGYITVRCNEDLTQLALRRVFLMPTDFLTQLRNWAVEQSGPLPSLYVQMEPTKGGPWVYHGPLRTRQRLVVEHVGPGRSFLWGPPGTGKTYTVGHLVVSLARRGFKVLVLAPTNVAVDLALIAVDQAFSQQGEVLESGQVLRAGQPELDALELRPHLLAWQQNENFGQKQIVAVRRRLLGLKRKLAGETRPSEQRRLDPEIEDCRLQLTELEEQRKRHLWQLVADADVLGCTVHSSYQRVQLSQFCQTPRLAVIYDEAGMVPRFAPVPLMAMLSGDESPCGQLSRPPEQLCVIYSGDPKQLGPIANPRSDDHNARGWLLDSVMENLPADTLMLDEQSRMDPEICRVVSRTYYQNQLKTVADPSRAPIPLVPEWPARGICLIHPQSSIHLPLSRWERKSDLARAAQFNELSVRIGALLIRWALDYHVRSVLWLTPFREQALRLIQVSNLLFAAADDEEPLVRAGTVHTSQGSEADLVIFDPVNTKSNWLGSEKVNSRLVNVALSRGRTQVFVLASRNQLRRTRFWDALHDADEYRIDGSPEEPHIRLNTKATG